MRLLLYLLLFIPAGCTSVAPLTYAVSISPAQPLQPPAQKVVVLNTFDAALYSSRKNKQELVTRLTDTLVKNISRQLQNAGIATEAIYGLSPVFTTADQGSIRALVSRHQATHAIVIKQVDLFFNQTNVQVTRTQSGKEREAFYDICTQVVYELYSAEGKLETVPVSLRRFHSSRSVASGLLAFGPSLASNSKDFFALANDNKDRFMRRFFPAQVTRSRRLFTDGPLKNVGAALKQKNYEKALAESLQLTESGNRAVAAMAWYNSAVFAERQNNEATARLYLQRSLRALRLPQAEAMLASLDD